MSIKFEKYQGIGNDFIILDYTNYRNDLHLNDLNKDLISKICNRHYGIGADGLIIINKGNKKSNSRMTIFNSDGSEAEMCGNGLRCLVKFMFDNKQIKTNEEVVIETKAGTIKASVDLSEEIKVNMGEPILSPDLIPTTLPLSVNGIVESQFELDGKLLNIAAAGMGNPHLIVFVQDLSLIPFHSWGPILEKNVNFPEDTNVHFVQIINKRTIKVLVWERGAGPTLACGTGACACIAITSKLGLTDNESNVLLPGGELIITWPSSKGDIYMRGKAKFVYAGRFTLKEFL